MTKPDRYWSSKKGEGQTAQWLFDHVNYDGDECLIWPFSTIRGYGNFGYEGEGHYAHRFMCELVNGPPPSPEHQAAHSCSRGEEGCVHPKHLSWKTPSQNQLDKRDTGRYYNGGRRRKLTMDDALQIRSLAGQKTHDMLAKQFGVSRRNIGAILSGKTHQTLLSRDRITMALKAARGELSAPQIAEAAGVNGRSVYTTLRRMIDDGEIRKVQSGYALPEASGGVR